MARECKCQVSWHSRIKCMAGHNMECLRLSNPNLIGAQNNFKRSRNKNG